MGERRIGSIRPRGRDRWQLVAEAPPDPRTGRRRQRTKIFRGSRRDAEKALTRFVVESMDHVVSSETATVDELVEQYLAVAGPDMSPSMPAIIRRDYDVYIRPTLGRMQVAKVEGHHLELLYAKLRATGGRCRLSKNRKCPPESYPCAHGGGGPLAATTVRRKHVIIHAAFEQACQWGWIQRNPADNVKRSKRISGKRKKPVPASTPDVAALTAWLAANDVELWAFVVMASRRGPRPGEVCALRWTDIDMAAKEITFARTIAWAPGRKPAWVEKPTKTDDERTISLVGVALAAVQDQRRLVVERALALGEGLAADEFVFSHGPGRPWLPGSWLSKRMTRARAASGVSNDVTFRALRHYVATKLIGKGVDPRKVAGILGHARASTTVDFYADWEPASDQAEALLMDDEIDGVDDDDGSVAQ
ncbi:MAG: integrase family protein [Actinomycetia bacterium]|nr:integrase family protein [Actinomycetes bacterium]